MEESGGSSVGQSLERVPSSPCGYSCNPIFSLKDLYSMESKRMLMICPSLFRCLSGGQLYQKKEGCSQAPAPLLAQGRNRLLLCE